MQKEELQCLSTEELLQIAETNIRDFRYGPSDIFKVVFDKYKEVNNEESVEKMRKEILLFDLSTHASSEKRFSEKMSGTTDKDEEWKYPDLERDFSDDSMSYYKQRYEESNNFFMKARYADFIWEKERNFQYAKLAIDSYLEVLDEYQKFGWEREIFDVVTRALQLSVLVNNRDYVDKSLVKLHGLLQHMKDKKQFRYTLDIMGFVVQNERRLRNKLELVLYKEIIEEAITSYKQESDSFHLQRSFIGLKVDIEKLEKNAGKVEGNLIRIAESYIEEAEWKRKNYPNGNMVASTFYEHAMNEYLKLGKFPEKVDYLKNKILECNKDAREHEYGVISTPVSIPKKAIDDYLKLYEDKTIQECLLMLSSDPQFLPTWENGIELAKKNALEFVFSQLVATSIMKGNICVKQISDPDEKIEYNAIQNFSYHYKLSANILMSKVFDFLKEMHYDFNKGIIDYLSTSGIIDEERLIFINHGISRFLEDDYVSSLHILVLQVEGILRDFIGKLGLPTFSYRNNEMRERMLPDILDTLDQVEGLNKDFLKFISIILNEIRGDNLRNDIAHGIASIDLFNKTNTILIIYLLLKLSNYRIATNTGEA